MLSMAACVSRSTAQLVAVVLLITVVIGTSAQEAICSGDDCLQNQSTSSQSGPLGAESACTAKDYPVGAKLSPVSGFRGSFLKSWACLHWKTGKRFPSYQTNLIASACSLHWQLTSTTSVSLDKRKNEIRYGLSLHSLTACITCFSDCEYDSACSVAVCLPHFRTRSGKIRTQALAVHRVWSCRHFC